MVCLVCGKARLFIKEEKELSILCQNWKLCFAFSSVETLTTFSTLGTPFSFFGCVYWDCLCSLEAPGTPLVRSMQYLSFWFSTGKSVELMTMVFKAWHFWYDLPKRKAAEWQGSEQCPAVVLAGAPAHQLACRLHKASCGSPAPPPHCVLVSELIQFASVHLLEFPIEFVLICWIVNRHSWDAGAHFFWYPGWMRKAWTGGLERCCLQLHKILSQSSLLAYVAFTNNYLVWKLYLTYYILSGWILLLTPFW